MAMVSHEPQTFWLQGQNPPLQGKESALAGIAEAGDLLVAQGVGVYVNRGTKDEPRWESRYVPTQSFLPANG